MKIKLKTYCLLTVIITLVSVIYSFQINKNIYDTLVDMANDEFTALILGNFSFMTALLTATFIKTIFFGQLTTEEIDSLFEQSKWSLMNSFLIITMFTDELNSAVILFITTKIFVKAFHWIVAIRIDSNSLIRESGPRAHIKLYCFIFILILVDFYCMAIFGNTLNKSYNWGIGAISYFEFTVLIVSAIYFGCKFCINILDAKYEGRWANKPMWMFLTKTIFLILILSLNLLFVLVITLNYGIPIYLLRDIYMLFYQIKSTFSKYYTYKKLIKTMHSSFPEVRGEEFNEIDRTCIICRDDMMVGKRLPCKHVFHLECLKNWFERQGVCPTCRAPISLRRVRSNATRREPIVPRARDGRVSERSNNRPNPPSSDGRAVEVPRPSAEDSSAVEFSSPGKTELIDVGVSLVELHMETEKALGGNMRATRTGDASSSGNRSGDSDKGSPPMSVIPAHLFETQTLLLQEHVMQMSAYLSRTQALLRKQLELQNKHNIYVEKRRRELDGGDE